MVNVEELAKKLELTAKPLKSPMDWERSKRVEAIQHAKAVQLARRKVRRRSTRQEGSFVGNLWDILPWCRLGRVKGVLQSLRLHLGRAS